MYTHTGLICGSYMCYGSRLVQSFAQSIFREFNCSTYAHSLLDHLSAVIQSSNRDFDPALTDVEVSQIAIIFNDNEN